MNLAADISNKIKLSLSNHGDSDVLSVKFIIIDQQINARFLVNLILTL